MPIVEEDIDGLSGLLFPFYDADTHMLYLAGKVRVFLASPMNLKNRSKALIFIQCMVSKCRFSLFQLTIFSTELYRKTGPQSIMSHPIAQYF